VDRALENDGLTARLAPALSQRDDVLVRTVFANFKYSDEQPVVKLWHALEPYPRTWHAASGVVIEELLADTRKRSGLVTEAERAWGAVPAGRATALYLLACADRELEPIYADRGWSTFGARFGGDIGPPLLGAMLDESPRAITVASVVWPALGKGWARSDVLLKRMDRFLDEPSVRRGDGGEPGKTVRSIVKRMCDEKAMGDVSRVHAYLAQRAAHAPDDASALGPLIADTAPGHCGKGP
jgi:hypothetical protein